jgi:hypothetical protein
LNRNLKGIKCYNLIHNLGNESSQIEIGEKTVMTTWELEELNKPYVDP